MIVARAPARISFGGGGTDLAAYYERHGGLVVSTAITCHCTVIARPTDDRSIRFSSRGFPISRTFPHGVRPTVEEPLSLPAAAIERFYDGGLRETGVEVVISSDIPHGSGLGSSSAVTVALVTALSAFVGRPLEPAEAADIACDIEINRLGMPIGRQDQYASAFGGLNVIEFERGGTRVSALGLSSATLQALDSRLILFSTGRTRDAADILRQQSSDSGSKPLVIESLHRIKDLARQMAQMLKAGDLDAFGQLMDTCWQEKKRLSDRISSGDIDRWYAAALQSGALGGKITGAGGGGFLMLYCPPSHQQSLRDRMRAMGLVELPFNVETTGATLLDPSAPEYGIYANPLPANEATGRLRS
ncbi:MAG TPA: hypothetical protein VHG52_05575 [Thermomicrobiales bacterium]|nr:hypothetical protein [Thermomicrobiales bacterium]